MLVLESFLCVSFSFHFKLGKSLQMFLCRLSINSVSFHCKSYTMNLQLLLLTRTLLFVYSAYVSSGAGTIASFLSWASFTVTLTVCHFYFIIWLRYCLKLSIFWRSAFSVFLVRRYNYTYLSQLSKGALLYLWIKLIWVMYRPWETVG